MKKTMFLWMAGGVLLVTLAFFIPSQQGSIWPSVIAGGIASLIYLAAFSVYGIRNIESPGKRKLVAAVLALLVIFSIASAWISYEGTQRQTTLLPEIRTTIEKGVAENQIKKPLLETMRAYYTEEGLEENASLGTIFTSKYDSLITDKNLLLYNGKGTYTEEEIPLKIYVKTVDPDSIVLIAESGYADGDNPDFDNYSGARGKYQTRGILTKGGIRYERTN